jgi:hypothetical protein
VSLLGLLEHTGSLLNLHPVGRNVKRCQDGVSRLGGILEILQHLGTFCNSLGKNLALLRQPLLLYDSEDHNNVHEVFLVVPMGEDEYTDVGCVRKLDLHKLRFLLGRDNVYRWYVWDG